MMRNHISLHFRTIAMIFEAINNVEKRPLYEGGK